MVLHKSKIPEQAIRRSEYSISLLARKLNKSRQHVYNLFEKEHIPIDTILQVGLIINHDFSEEIKELTNIPQDYKYAVLNEPESVKNSSAYWRGKYLELLERHQLLLEEQFEKYLELSKHKAEE